MREGYMNLSTDVGNGIDDGGPEGARRATGKSPGSGVIESIAVSLIRELFSMVISPTRPTLIFQG